MTAGYLRVRAVVRFAVLTTGVALAFVMPHLAVAVVASAVGL
ncbi:hypothetical protein [Arthrobacter sp. SD76]